MSAKYQWKLPPDEQSSFAKRPRTCRLLDESLLEFPDPSSLNRSGDSGGVGKLTDTISCLNDRHNEQRRRLLERQEQEYKAWENDTDKQLDPANRSFNHAFGLKTPAVGIPSESWQLINSDVAKQALQRLPISKRKTLVSSDQLKEWMPGLLPESEKALRNLPTSVELAAVLAEHGTRIRRKMVNEEQDLRFSQLEGTRLFHAALVRSDAKFRNPPPRPVTQKVDSPSKRQSQFSFQIPTAPTTTKTQPRERSSAFDSSSIGQALVPKSVLVPPKSGPIPPTLDKREEPSRDPRLKPPEHRTHDDRPRDPRLH